MKERIKQALEKATQGEWKEFELEHTKREGGVYRYITSGRGHLDEKTMSGFCISGFITPSDTHLIANAPEWLRWQNERIEQLEDAVESLYQLIQRGDLTSFDLKEADNVLQALGKEV